MSTCGWWYGAGFTDGCKFMLPSCSQTGSRKADQCTVSMNLPSRLLKGTWFGACFTLNGYI